MFFEHSYPEYYSEQRERFANDPDEGHKHLGSLDYLFCEDTCLILIADHCVDLLRQKILCDADMTLITYN